MIYFMYGLNYEFYRENPCCFGLLSAIKLYGIAIKYEVPTLKKPAKETFEAVVKAGCCWDSNDVPTAIELIYSTTPEGDRGLRDAIVNNALEQAGVLMKNGSFLRVLKDCSSFNEDFVQRLFLTKTPSASTSNEMCCSSCLSTGNGSSAVP